MSTQPILLGSQVDGSQQVLDLVTIAYLFALLLSCYRNPSCMNCLELQFQPRPSAASSTLSCIMDPYHLPGTQAAPPDVPVLSSSNCTQAFIVLPTRVKLLFTVCSCLTP